MAAGARLKNFSRAGAGATVQNTVYGILDHGLIYGGPAMGSMNVIFTQRE
jgi:hypothetical protein